MGPVAIADVGLEASSSGRSPDVVGPSAPAGSRSTRWGLASAALGGWKAGSVGLLSVAAAAGGLFGTPFHMLEAFPA